MHVCKAAHTAHTQKEQKAKTQPCAVALASSIASSATTPRIGRMIKFIS
jgi:hypothetical protein